LVRQLAEALKFAHDKHANHRGLCPQSVLVFSPDSPKPQLKIYNWQTGHLALSSTSAGSTRVSATVHPDFFWEDLSFAYVAPEVINDGRNHHTVHNGRKLFKRLAGRMEANPALRVVFCLDIARKATDTSLSSDIVRRFALEFVTKHCGHLLPCPL